MKNTSLIIRLVVTLIILMNSVTHFAQNLVRNGDFQAESSTVTSCVPFGPGELFKTTFWGPGYENNPGSPDLFDSRVSPSDGETALHYDLPQNKWYYNSTSNSIGDNTPGEPDRCVGFSKGESIIGFLEQTLTNSNCEYTISLFARSGNGEHTYTITSDGSIYKLENNHNYILADNKIEIVLRSGFWERSDDKVILIDEPINQIDWKKISTTFTLDATDIQRNYNRIEIRLADNPDQDHLFKAIFIDDIELIDNAPTAKIDLNYENTFCINNNNDVYVDGSNSENETEYRWTIVEINNIIAATPQGDEYIQPWQLGEVGITNLSQLYNDGGYSFGEGKCYRVNLIVRNTCGTWVVATEFICIQPSVQLEILSQSFSPPCEGTPITIKHIDDLNDSQYTFNWEFPNGQQTSIETLNFNAVQGMEGEYCLTITENATGCKWERDCINLEVQDIPDFSITVPSMCIDEQEDGYNFISEILNETDGVNYNYLWGFGEGTISHDEYPSHIYSESGEYTVSLIISNDCGSNMATALITISPAPQIREFTINPICIDAGPTQLSAVPAGGTWSGSNITSDGVFTPDQNASAYPATYPVTYILENNLGCDDEESALVSVVQRPTITMPDDIYVCENDPAFIIEEPSTNGITGEWKSGRGAPGQAQYFTVSTGEFDPQIAGVGTYSLMYCAENQAKNCETCETMKVIVCTGPDVTLSYDNAYCNTMKEATITPSITGGEWGGILEANGDGTFDPSALSPGVYSTSYTVAGEEACSLGENIIKNGCFGEVLECPHRFTEDDDNVSLFEHAAHNFDGVPDWSSAFVNGTVDLYHQNCSNSGADFITIIPTDESSDVCSSEKDGFAGIITHQQRRYRMWGGELTEIELSDKYSSVADPVSGTVVQDHGYGASELLHQELETPMEIGKKYHFSFKVRLAEESNVASHIGIYFSETHSLIEFSDLHDSRYVTPNVIDNKEDWYEISGDFVPETTINHILIGQYGLLIGEHSPEAITNCETCPADEFNPYGMSIWFSYYFIDDVSIQEMNTCETTVEANIQILPCASETGGGPNTGGGNPGKMGTLTTELMSQYCDFSTSDATEVIEANLIRGNDIGYKFRFVNNSNGDTYYAVSSDNEITLSEVMDPAQLPYNATYSVSVAVSRNGDRLGYGNYGNACNVTYSCPDIVVEPSITQLCSGNSNVLLEVLGGTEPYSYNWSNGATGKEANLSPGYYNINVTDVYGCNASIALQITDPEPLTISYEVTNAQCEDGAIDIVVSGGTAPYTYEWNNGSLNEDLEGIGMGDYEVVVTDANNCNISASIHVESQDISSPTDLSDVIAYYPFTGNANDESNNGNNGVLHNPTLTTDRFGRAGEAYQFNGVDQWIEIPHNTEFDLNGEISISMWLYIPQGTISINAKWRRLVTRHITGGSGVTNYTLFYNSDNKSIRALVNGSAGTRRDFNSGDNSVVEDEWMHVVFTYDDNNVSKLYINGIEMNQDIGVSQTINYQVQPTYIEGGASSNPMPVYIWNGKIDDIAFYSRALCANEVVELYDISAPLTVNIETTNTCNNTGTAIASVSGGIAPYTYAWLDVNGNTIGNTELIQDLYPGVYTLLVTDATGNELNNTVVISTSEVCGEIRTLDCNATTNSIARVIYADYNPNAVNYKFVLTGVTNGVVYERVQSSTKLTLSNVVDPTQLPYNQDYIVQVQIQYYNAVETLVWSDLGTECMLHLNQPPSRIRPEDCDFNTSSLASFIFTTQVIGHTQYKFTLVGSVNGKVYEHTQNSGKLTLSNITSPTQLPYDQDYAITVETEYYQAVPVSIANPEGRELVWTEAGEICTLHLNTPPHKIRSQDCDFTTSNLSSYIYAVQVINYNQFKFILTGQNDGIVYEREQPSTKLVLSDVISPTQLPLGQDYHVVVDVEYYRAIPIVSDNSDGVVDGMELAWTGTGTSCTLHLLEPTVQNKKSNSSDLDVEEEFDTLLSEDLSIYPNPNNGSFTIEGNEIDYISVMDLTGRVVFESRTTNSIIEINLDNQSKGMYLVKVVQNGNTKMERIVVQ